MTLTAEFPPPGESSRPVALSQVRASDADRDRVVEVLRVAVGDGRLTADEFEERLGSALTSRTLGELAALTADLVAGSPGPAGPTGSPGPAAATPTATKSAEDVSRIDQRGGSVQRGGQWVVPKRLVLRPSWCDVMLDFTDAVITHDALPIDLNMRGGSLVLILRPGIVVDAGALSVRYTDVKLGSAKEPSAPVILNVQLTGRMRYGWIETR
jgi:hypothetical protein